METIDFFSDCLKLGYSGHPGGGGSEGGGNKSVTSHHGIVTFSVLHLWKNTKDSSTGGGMGCRSDLCRLREVVRSRIRPQP